MEISAKKEIHSFLHCKQCVQEVPKGESPSGYQKIDVGFTPQGLQIWCQRHDMNIIHIDFQGMRHPANMAVE